MHCNCNEVRERLLAGKVDAVIDAHIAECAECSALRNTVLGLNDLAQSWQDEPVPHWQRVPEEMHRCRECGTVQFPRFVAIAGLLTGRFTTTDRGSGAKTKLATFRIDRGCSLDQMSQLCLEVIPKDLYGKEDEMIERNTTVAKSGFYISKRQIAGRTLPWLLQPGMNAEAASPNKSPPSTDGILHRPAS